MCQTSEKSTFEEEFEHSLDKGDYLNFDIKEQQKLVVQETEVSNTLVIPTSVLYSQPMRPPQQSILFTLKASNINFLKNLVKLIKMWVKIGKMERKEDQQLVNLWKLFISAKKHNKNLFRIIYGGIRETEETIELLFKEFGEQSYFERVGYQYIKELQSYLRNQTIKQIVQADIEHIIKNRRVQNKEQFTIFLNQFIDQLQDGHLTLRQIKSKSIFE